MADNLPQYPDLGPDGLSGWPGSHDPRDASWAGLWIGTLVGTLTVDDGVYLPGDVIDDRWADDRPPRVFIPHGPVWP